MRLLFFFRLSCAWLRAPPRVAASSPANPVCSAAVRSRRFAHSVRSRRALFAAGAFVWGAPKVQKSLAGVRKAEYEIASPIDDDIRAARERFQKQLDKDAAEAEKLRKEAEEKKRQERLDELKNGPKASEAAKGRQFAASLRDGEGQGKRGGMSGVKPCPPGG